MKYHHFGIPSSESHPGERYVDHLRAHVSPYHTNPYGIEWMRFDKDSPLPELVRTVPHVAFEVDDVEAAIAGKEVLVPPRSPVEGVIVAFIVHSGAPVEFLQFDYSKRRRPGSDDQVVRGGRY